MTRRATTAISALLAIVLALFAASSLAQQRGAGYVANLSGPLFAVKADGTRRILSVQSVVEPGDTLITEDKTYARVRFTDTSEVTLRPKTQFRVETYHFEEQAPDKDGVAFRLLKGALRTVTGLIGKRGSVEAYRMSTETATIGIRGTAFGVTVCLPGTCGSLAPGTYVNVFDGSVAIAPALPLVPFVPAPVPPVAAPGAPPAAPPAPAPPAAPVVLSAGQVGFVPPFGPPLQLPSDPGVGRIFTPPPSFQQRQDAPPPQQPGTPAPRASTPSGGGECEVR